MQSDTMSVTAMCALTVYPSLIKSEVMVIEDESLSHSSLEEVVILLTISLPSFLYLLLVIFSFSSKCEHAPVSIHECNVQIHLSYIYYFLMRTSIKLSPLYSLEHFIFTFESFCLYSS